MKNIKIIEKSQENIDEITGLLSEKQSAKYLGISYENLKRSIRYKGLISFVKFRKGVRYKRADLDAYINKHRVSATI
jgi:excisionase family DNA binding protein